MSKLKVSSNDIFPLIKQFLYNDQDIFLRELVSNAVDATQKLVTLNNKGEYDGNINKEVTVYLDKDNNTLTISDNGIGMTKEEVEKYICQIAFSGASEFIEKYKDADIIGHFGMGFYSAFMVADKVEIITRSYKSDTEVHWVCNGNVNYKITEKDNSEMHIGTDIILYISDSYKEYFNVSHIKSLLTKYNKFIKVPVRFVEVLHEYVDSSTNETVHPDNIETVITSDNALWTKNPADLSDEDYINFYHELYPNKPDPVFWLHLNIDHPFTFTGILYFPAYDKAKPLFERNHLALYCNQVFVTNNLEGVLPEYLRLLHGIIDSPDIPLNMSRSEAQSDTNVKKIKTYISSKVMTALKKIMKKDRAEYEKKWDTIKTFINLGVIMEEDVFEKAKDILLLTDIDNNHYTLDEYYEKVKDNQTNVDNQTVYLYTFDKDAQYTYVNDIQKLGYNILLMDKHYASFEAHQLEIEFNDPADETVEKKNIKFKRVDSEPINKLIVKTKDTESSLSDNVKNMVLSLFNTCIPKVEKFQFQFAIEDLGKDYDPITVNAAEFMRRMKDMQTMNNEGIYVGMDQQLTLVLNADADIIKLILSNAESAIGNQVSEINNKMQEWQTKRKEAEDNKTLDDELTKSIQTELGKLNEEKMNVIAEYAKTDNHINELIDIALLQYGLLYGEQLHKFIKRSFKMISQ